MVDLRVDFNAISTPYSWGTYSPAGNLTHYIQVLPNQAPILLVLGDSFQTIPKVRSGMVVYPKRVNIPSLEPKQKGLHIGAKTGQHIELGAKTEGRNTLTVELGAKTGRRPVGT